MKLTIVGTGSSGNCYILQNADTALIIESGISFDKVKEAIDFELHKIEGVLISHSHNDHSKYVREYVKRGIKVHLSKPTRNELELSENERLFTSLITPKVYFNAGHFVILPFELYHDVYCLGFQIDHPDCGRVVFITDTKYSPYTFDGVNNWIIECNHSRQTIIDRIERQEMNQFLGERIMNNHLSIESLKELFSANDIRNTNKIVLIHGSDDNSNSIQFRNALIDATGKDVYIAEKNITLNFNKEL